MVQYLSKSYAFWSWSDEQGEWDASADTWSDYLQKGKDIITYDQFYAHLDEYSPENIKPGTAQLYFKAGVQPEWHQSKQRPGAIFHVDVEKDLDFKNYWTSILFKLIHVNLYPFHDSVDGVFLESRKRSYRIGIWVNDAKLLNHPEFIKKLQFLFLGQNIVFSEFGTLNQITF